MYRGWWVVAGAFLVLAIAYGVQFSYGVFLPAMADSLGWSRAELSAPYSVFVAVYTGLSFATGRLTDRIGPTRVIAAGAACLALGYGLLSTTTILWEPYLYLGLLAALGASVAFVPCNATVIRWFVARRGLALGIASSGVSAAAAFAPPLAGLLIEHFGWRTAMLSLALAGGISMAAAARLMARDPESHGLRPDGGGATPPGRTAESSSGASSGETGSWTLSAALGTATFWTLLAALFCTWLVVFLPFVHLGAYGLDQGLSALDAANLIGAIGLGGLIGRVTTGGITDRYGRVPGLVLALALQALAFLGFGASHSLGWLLGWAFLYGVGYSGVSVLFPALAGDLFGRRHIGDITGFLFGLGGIAAAAGPYFAGLLYDMSGEYLLAFLVASILNSFALALLSAVRAPRAATRRPRTDRLPAGATR